MIRFKNDEKENIYKNVYGPAVSELFMKMGGSIYWAALSDLKVLIDTRGFGHFQEAFLIRYPSLQMFTEFLSSDAMVALNELRLQAMDGGLLQWSVFQPVT